MATPPGAYPSYVISSYDSPGSSPVPFWIARLMFSWGMFASLAISVAALRRMFALGSPPPFLAATVISRRIFEKSLPRWTSALPFLRLICDHRECPDIALPSFVRECRLESFHALEPQLTPGHRLAPAPLLTRRLRGEGWARPRPQVGSQMHEREERRAGVAHLPRPRYFTQDLDANLERGGAHVVEPGPEGDDLVREDRGVEIQRVQARRHDEALAVPHRQDPAGLVERHQHLADEHRVPEQRVLRQHAARRLEAPAHVAVGLGRRVTRPRCLLREPREPLRAPPPGRLGEARLGRVRGLDLHGDGARPHVVAHLHEHEVGVERHRARAGLDVLGPNAHADLERRRPDVLDLRFQNGDLADPHGVEEVDVVRRPEDDLAARDAPRRERSRLGDPLHHPPAVDLARGARMLGKHPLDHLDDGVRDRRHTGTLPPCPARLEATAAP